MIREAALARSGAPRRLLGPVLALATAPAVALAVVRLEVGGTATIAAAAVGGSLLLAALRPEWAILLTLALFSDVLYFGTFGFSLPIGQLVVGDVLLLGWWGVTLAAILRGGGPLVRRSPLAVCLVALHPALVLLLGAWSWLAFGATTQEMLRAGRPVLHLGLFAPLAWWLGRPGALERLWRAAVLLCLAAAGLQFVVYVAGIDVEPYGLFYEWQVWRSAFHGFDRSNQPFFGLALILIGGLVSMGLRDPSRRRRLAAGLCAAVLLVSALLSFGRGYWAAVAAAGLLAAAIEGRARGTRPLHVAASVCGAVVVALAVLASAGGVELPGFFEAAVDRGEEGASSLVHLEGTFGDRFDNVNWHLIREHPWLGVGFYLALGGAQDLDYAATGHSLPADLLLRMGVVGAAAAAILLAAFLGRCRSALARALSPQARALVVGSLAAAIGNLLWGLSSSHAMQSRGMVEIALMAAIVEAAAGGSPAARPAVAGGAA